MKPSRARPRPSGAGRTRPRASSPPRGACDPRPYSGSFDCRAPACDAAARRRSGTRRPRRSRFRFCAVDFPAAGRRAFQPGGAGAGVCRDGCLARDRLRLARRRELAAFPRDPDLFLDDFLLGAFPFSRSRFFFATVAAAFFRFFFAILSPRCCPLDHAGRQDRRRDGAAPGAAAISHGVKMANAARRMLIVRTNISRWRRGRFRLALS